MARLLHRNLPTVWRKYATTFLAFSWCSGLFCGIVLYFSAGDPSASLMRMAVTGYVSIVDLLMSVLLPFLISALAVYIFKPGLLAVFAFIKACLFAFFSMGTLEAFGSAGWLIRLLLMFSDICMTVVLYLYWMRHVSGQRKFSVTYSGAYGAAALLIGSIDYCFIAPKLAQILEI